MSQIQSTVGQAANDQPFGSANTLNDLNLDTFLTLMITELQNQDPLNPLENDQLLTQISQIRAIGASEKLTQTLDSVLLGQNISSATALLGADIQALSDDGERVEGLVERISIEEGKPKLHLELNSRANTFPQSGDLEAGSYRYFVTWEDEAGNLLGVDLTADGPIETTGTDGTDTSIRLSNLPTTTGPKQIFRTDSTGTGDYLLVGELEDGSKGSFVDKLSDDNRTAQVSRGDFQRLPPLRNFTVSLSNVSDIRPPGR